jgi:hypothetical protein
MHRITCMWTKVVAFVLLVGCQQATAHEEPVPSPKPPPRYDDALMLRFHMYRHLDMARATERLLVRGNLEGARALAASMADAPDPAGLEAWARQAAVLRKRTRAIANAASIDEACRRMAELSEACGSCHDDAGALVELDVMPPLPADRQTMATRMARHTWAADRLWEGIIGDADVAWRAGLDVLAQTPPPFSPLEGDRLALAKRLQDLADEGRQRARSDSRRERAGLYGEILVTCAACHINLPGAQANEVGR